MNGKIKSLTIAALALLTIASVASAQVAPNDGSWKNSWTGYLWLPGHNGDAIIQGSPVDVDISVSDTVQSLDKMEASFAGHYEGKMMGYGFLADVNYWKLSEDFYTDTGQKGEFKPSQLILELAGFGSVYQKTMGGISVTNVEAMVGARYNHLRMEYGISNTDIDYSKSKNYIDPFVGFRVYQALAPKWAANLRADVGGFGIGSDLSWQVIGTFGYHIDTKHSVLLGWRHYSQDYTTGEGAEEFKWNVASSGPFLGFQSRF